MLGLCSQFLGGPDALSLSLCPLWRAGAAQLPLGCHSPCGHPWAEHGPAWRPCLGGDSHLPEPGSVREGHFGVCPSKAQRRTPCARLCPGCCAGIANPARAAPAAAQLCSRVCHRESQQGPGLSGSLGHLQPAWQLPDVPACSKL